MENGVSGLNGQFVIQPVTVAENKGPDFVTLHFQLMVEVNVLGLAMKRYHVTQIHVPVCSSIPSRHFSSL